MPEGIEGNQERSPRTRVAELEKEISELKKAVKALLLAAEATEAELDENLMPKGEYLGHKFD